MQQRLVKRVETSARHGALVAAGAVGGYSPPHGATDTDAVVESAAQLARSLGAKCLLVFTRAVHQTFIAPSRYGCHVDIPPTGRSTAAGCHADIPWRAARPSAAASRRRRGETAPRLVGIRAKFGTKPTERAGLHAHGLVRAPPRAPQARPPDPRGHAVRRRRAEPRAVGVRLPGGAGPGGRRRGTLEPILQDA